ncbi:MAG TPA: M50 family metallopeptidase, partial [Propionibacteriaceae bacterium]|nr:M50 family metallopeptidase [Propionibacteriaceae bacterium]
MELFAEIWRRATSVQPTPPAALVALTAAIAFGLVISRAAWPYTRMLVTITHEGGHAVAALLAGRRLQGIRLHSDASGLTVSSGRPSGPGMVVMLLAGYLAPAVVGLGAGALLIIGYSLGLLWLLVILLALMLLRIRNFAGFWILLVAAGGLVVVSWYAPAPAQAAVAYLVTWILLLSAP